MLKICNINILLKSKEVNQESLQDVMAVLMGVTSNSFISNRDGDGVYFDYNDVLVKSLQKINYCRFEKQIRDSKFILTHQRIATSGLTEKYTQPFSNNSKDFVILHNGIMSEFVEGKHSDTYNFFNKFLRSFKDSVGTREQKTISSIKELLKEVGGSWSIAI